MYSLKPILVDQAIDLPSCMYQMKPINLDMIGNMQNSINNSGKSEVEQLEARQNLILKKLDELKQTLLLMRGDLQTSKSGPSSKPTKPAQQSAAATVKKPIDSSNLVEVVVNVHPSNVPYSILALKTQWANRLNLSVEVFTHSSIKESDFTKAAKDFVEKVTKPELQNNLPTLNVTIIWKDVETTQMLTSPSKFIPIYGEVNIIRFLNRVGPNEFQYEHDNQFATLSDAVLDICYQLSKKHSVKERQAYVQQLSQRLGKSQYFNSSESLAISDIAVSSILKKLFSNTKELPSNLSSWLQKMSPIAGY